MPVKWMIFLLWGCLLTGSLNSWAASPVIEVYADLYPPFIILQGGQLSGPYIDAFTQLAQEQGIAVHYQPMPVRRLMKQLAVQPNSCGLAVNFAPGEAETIRYVGRVAPITLAVYARAGVVGKLANLEQLRQYRIGAIDVAELNELLDNAAIRYEPLAKAGNGIAMLQANRFDLLVSDVLPELLMVKPDGVTIERVMVLARVERWLACHPGLPPMELNRLRKALQVGVFADSVQGIWSRYGLLPVYDEVRREWGTPNRY
jgi:hypothetical protein